MPVNHKQHLPIVSLSLNPAIDLTYEIADLKHDHKTRATKTYFDPGGTGINVGRALEKLKANSYTCCITAGKMGDFLHSMLEQELSNVSTLQVDGETRINTTLIQQQPKFQYAINAAGPTISPDKLKQCSKNFLNLCQQGIGILTGSLPPGVSADYYQQINQALKQQGGRCIIDAPVSILKRTLTGQPFLIKPNQHELEALTGKTLDNRVLIAHEARKLVDQGIENVCVSLAEQGAILCNKKNSYFCNAPKIKLHSSVGAGDSLVAGFAYAFACEQPVSEALKFAVACGAGTAAKPGTQLFEVAEIDKLTKQLKVTALDI